MSSSSRIIGRYRILAELGRGGMSEVYVAVAQGPAGFSKLVVVKVLQNALVKEDPEFVRMFLDEARLAARLNHANVVQTNEVGADGDRYFIAMEYLEGQPLQRVINRSAKAGKRIPLRVFLRILSKSLEGLHAAHTARDYNGAPLNVVHRDATPHNVFITYDGQVKIVDFGIAKASGRASESTRLGILKGKVVYMPPEQARGQPLDCRADLFAIGVALFDRLSPRRLWQGQSEVEVVAKLISHEYPRSPRSAATDIPEALDAICQKALAPDPADRYPDGRAMQADIEAFLATTEQAGSDREVGAYVTELFEKDRADIETAIQSALRTLGDDPNAWLGDTPLANLAIITAPGVGSSSSSPPSLLPKPTTGVSEMPPAGRKRGVWLVAALLALLLLATGVIIAQRLGHEPAAIAAAPSAPAAAPTPTPTTPAPTPSPAASIAAIVEPSAPTPRNASAAAAASSAAPARTTAVPQRQVAAAPPAPPKAAPPPVAAPPAAEPAPPRSTKPDLGY